MTRRGCAPGGRRSIPECVHPTSYNRRGSAYRVSTSVLIRLFAADVAALKAADDGIPQTVAPIEEIQLYVSDSSGEREDVTLFQLIERELGRAVARADLHLSESRDGELFVTSRQDGWIRVLVPD